MSSDNRFLLLSTNHKKVSSFAYNECYERTRLLSQRAEASRGLQTRGTDFNFESHSSTGTRSYSSTVRHYAALPSAGGACTF